MQTHLLSPHPAHEPRRVRSVEGRIGLCGTWLLLRWRIEGSEELVLPPFAGARRRDGLWRTTCCEIFVRPDGGGAYSEFNLSPSDAWAAYDFEAPRTGMRERAMSRAPVITRRVGGMVTILDAAIALADLPGMPWDYSLAAVIEEQGGALSYWAMRHGGERPDFHDPACFTGRLAAPAAP